MIGQIELDSFEETSSTAATVESVTGGNNMWRDEVFEFGRYIELPLVLDSTDRWHWPAASNAIASVQPRTAITAKSTRTTRWRTSFSRQGASMVSDPAGVSLVQKGPPGGGRT
jgi:hypothetical protein